MKRQTSAVLAGSESCADVCKIVFGESGSSIARQRSSHLRQTLTALEKDIEDTLPQFQELLLSISYVSPFLPFPPLTYTSQYKHILAQHAFGRDAQAAARVVRRIRSTCEADSAVACAARRVAGSCASGDHDASEFVFAAEYVSATGLCCVFSRVDADSYLVSSETANGKV